MNKDIISLKVNRINSFPGIDSVSSISLLINRLGTNPSIEFKTLLITHDNYIISRDRLEGMNQHTEDLKKEDSDKFIKIHPENIKSYLESILSGIDEIYMISGFSDLEDQMDCTELVLNLFRSYKVKLFNTMNSPEKESDLLFCQSNLKKFIKYIT
jgi:hypothetical protein